MDAWRTVLMGIPLLLAGCIAAPEPAQTLEHAEGTGPVEPPCPSGTLFEDLQQLTNGGQGEDVFAIPPGCVVLVDFRVEQQVGELAVRIASPDHELLTVEGTAIGLGPINVIPGGSRSVNAGTVPAGNYTYAFRAQAVADFAVRVFAE